MRRGRFAPALLMLGVVVVVSSCFLKEDAPEVLPEVPVPPGQVAIIDTRTLDEYSAGHVEGALLMPYTNIAEMVEQCVPDKNAPVYLYCQRGWRSEMARKTLEEMGYSSAVSLGTLADTAEKLNKRVIKPDKKDVVETPCMPRASGR